MGVKHHFLDGDVAFDYDPIQQTTQLRVGFPAFVDHEDFFSEVLNKNAGHLVPPLGCTVSFQREDDWSVNGRVRKFRYSFDRVLEKEGGSQRESVVNDWT